MAVGDVIWGAAVMRPDNSNGFRIGHEFSHSWGTDYSSLTISLHMWVGTRYARADASNNWDVSGDFNQAKAAGFKPNVFLLADHGFSTYSTTVEVRREFIEKNAAIGKTRTRGQG